MLHCKDIGEFITSLQEIWKKERFNKSYNAFNRAVRQNSLQKKEGYEYNGVHEKYTQCRGISILFLIPNIDCG